jgi:hypothetical protein
MNLSLNNLKIKKKAARVNWNRIFVKTNYLDSIDMKFAEKIKRTSELIAVCQSKL